MAILMSDRNEAVCGCPGYCPDCGEPVLFVNFDTFQTSALPLHCCSATKITWRVTRL